MMFAGRHVPAVHDVERLAFCLPFALVAPLMQPRGPAPLTIITASSSGIVHPRLSVVSRISARAFLPPVHVLHRHEVTRPFRLGSTLRRPARCFWWLSVAASFRFIEETIVTKR